MSRISCIYNHYPNEFSIRGAQLQLKSAGIDQASIFQIGNNPTQFFINISGNVIKIDGSFVDVIPVLMGLYSLLDLKYPTIVNDVYYLFEYILNIESGKCSKSTLNVIRQIERSISN